MVYASDLLTLSAHNVPIDLSNMQMILHYSLVNTAQWMLFRNTIIFVPGLLETS